MSETQRFNLPLLAAAQAQKHITHNEALIRLDRLMHLALVSRGFSTPPTAQEGEAYLVPNGASGVWAGADGQLAFYEQGSWIFTSPVIGQTAFVQDEGRHLIFDGTSWLLPEAPVTSETVLAQGALGARSWHKVIEADLSNLSGGSVTAPGLIPNRAIVMCVSTRTSETVQGASSYDCGILGETNKFGGNLGVAAGSSNLGVIGPTAFYSPTDVVLTARDGTFTGGRVKLAVHCFVPEAPV